MAYDDSRDDLIVFYDGSYVTRENCSVEDQLRDDYVVIPFGSLDYDMFHETLFIFDQE